MHTIPTLGLLTCHTLKRCYRSQLYDALTLSAGIAPVLSRMTQSAMTADELAQAVATHMFSEEGTGSAWGIKIEEARSGYARVSMTVREDMLNGHRIVHGGMVFALADSAFAYVCNGRNEKTVAAQASIVFLGSASEGDMLIAEAEEVAMAGRSGVTRVAVRTANGRAIAEFTGYSRTLGGAVVEV
jgi:acyl-CoA thioesterase